MGKKHVITQSEEELIKEGEKIESKKEKKDVKEVVQRVRDGRIYIFSSYNNTIITLTDARGGVLSWASAGQAGFKGTKKSTPFAASKVAENLVAAAKKIGIERVDVFVKGIGSGRESALRSISSHGLDITSIKDITPIPHNGCRPPKTRRV